MLKLSILLSLFSQYASCDNGAFFTESFNDLTSGSTGRWIKSTHEKYSAQQISMDDQLVFEKAAAHYGISVAFDKPFDMSDKNELVIQYEVRLQDGLDCGGAYMKLLDTSISSTDLTDDSPYIIMFGPDKCGSESKVHFIVRHQNPVTKTWQEKHLATRPSPVIDTLTHLYTLVIRKDNAFEIFIDQKSVSSGNMLDEGVFEPPFTLAKRIPDPSDKKPTDWIDEAEIDDPTAVKPDDWDEDAPATILDEEAEKPDGWLDDESDMISDPSAEKPQDWDDEDDGEWEAPLVVNPKCAEVGCGEWKRPMKANPAYKGKWSAPKIANPEYKGEWSPQEIDNPEYFEELNPAQLKPIGGIGLEIWTMSSGITFDNFWLGYDLSKATDYAKSTWAVKSAEEQEKAQQVDAEEKKKVKDALLEQGGVKNLMQAYAMDIQEIVQTQPYLYGGAGALLIVFLFNICCMKRKTATDEEEDVGKHKKNDGEGSPAKPASKDDSDDGEKKVRQRKKAPKAE